MGFDFEHAQISEVTRLFPLPDVVLFPNAVISLHIFEPRYRRMTEDALAGDGQITIVQTVENELTDRGLPALESIGCAGVILSHERLADGRFNLFLLGRKRVRLLEELDSETPYRVARVELVEDIPPPAETERSREELITLFRDVSGIPPETREEFEERFSKRLALGPLTDVLAHTMSFPSFINQMLLSEPDVRLRVEHLLRMFKEAASRRAPKIEQTWPPPFSKN